MIVATGWPVLRAEFIHWDDGLNITGNPHLSFSWDNLRWMFTDASYVRRYMPIGWISYAIDRVLVGLNPLSYHLGNLILHGLNALLLLEILQKILRRVRPEADKTLGLCAAGIGTLWWALHPLRAEALGWASGRIYCVAALFFFLSVWAYLHQAEAVQPRRWQWLAFLGFTLSLLTYPIALGGLAVFVFLDVFILKRLPTNLWQWHRPENRRVLGEKTVYLLPFIVSFAANLWSRLSQTTWEPVLSFAEFSFLSRCLQAAWVWAWYLWKPWLPFDLAPKYPDLLPSVDFTSVHVAAALLVIGVTALLFFRRKAWPLLFLAWLCHLALVLPFIGFTERPHHTCDRYGYIPGMVWAAVIAVVMVKWTRHRQRQFLAYGGSAVVCVLMAVLLYQQTWIWRDGLSVQRTIVKSLTGHPECAHEEWVASALLLNQGKAVEAESSLRHALEWRPAWAEAWSALGYALAEQRKTEEAVKSYGQALQLQPGLDSARQNLAVTLAEAGRHQEAVAELQKLLERNPLSASAHHNLSRSLQQLGQSEAAKHHSMEARRLQQRARSGSTDPVL